MSAFVSFVSLARRTKTAPRFASLRFASLRSALHSWVYSGLSTLDPVSDLTSTDKKTVTRAFYKLSPGGSDATVIREFDLATKSFVKESDSGYTVPEGKSSLSFKSRDVAIFLKGYGKDDVTDSGYAMKVREWKRGTPIEDAKVLFKGEKSDVSVGGYVNDQRFRTNGAITEWRYRSTTFYTTLQWVRFIDSDDLQHLSKVSEKYSRSSAHLVSLESCERNVVRARFGPPSH